MLFLILLNQVSWAQAHAWFLKFAFVCDINMYVCVPAFEAINN